jgi:hypothetical protein
MTSDAFSLEQEFFNAFARPKSMKVGLTGAPAFFTTARTRGTEDRLTLYSEGFRNRMVEKTLRPRLDVRHGAVR